MILPNGVTGFYSLDNEKPPTVDRKRFMQQCFSALQNLGGELLRFNDPYCQGNLIDVEVKLAGKKLHVLLNKHYPYVAFASNVEYGSVTFVADFALSEQFSPIYRVLSCRGLNEPVLLTMGSKRCLLQNKNELNQAVLKQVADWKPGTIGAIVFNQLD